jgi:hypothetical protein
VFHVEAPLFSAVEHNNDGRRFGDKRVDACPERLAECYLLWNWFVVPAFHVSDISFWLMYGLVLIVSMFSNPSDQSFDADRRTKSLMTAIEACIPEDRREFVREELESQSKEIWLDVGAMIFGRAFGNTVALGVGFIVHALASA